MSSATLFQDVLIPWTTLGLFQQLSELFLSMLSRFS